MIAAMNAAHDEAGPVTPFERNFYLFLLTFFLALLGAEIISDFHPVKLGVLFFVLFWPPLVALHEAGHALMAALLGWEVRHIVIGYNREVWSGPIAGIPVTVKLLPLGGHVVPVPRNLSWPRCKLALIYLAGPGIELVLLALIVALCGPTLLLTRSTDYGVIALQALAITILYGAITSLIPLPQRVGEQTVYSDGLGFVRSFTMTADEFASLRD